MMLCSIQLAIAAPIFNIAPSVSTFSLAKGASSNVSFTVTNKSGIELTVDGIKGVGDGLVSIQVDSSTCGTLANDASCTVSASVTAGSTEGLAVGDLHVCAFNGSVCSGSAPKLAITIGGATPLTSSFAYIANNPFNSISVCAVRDDSGELTNCQSTKAGGSFSLPAGVAIHPDGDYLYVANYGESVDAGLITYCKINSDTGAISDCVSFSDDSIKNPTMISISPNGNHIYISDTMNKHIIHCAIDNATKALGDCGSLDTFGQSLLFPVGTAISPDGTHAYIIDQGNHRIIVCAIAGTGLFESCDKGFAFGKSIYPFGIVVNSAGNKAFVTHRSSAIVYQCDINTDTGAISSCESTGGVSEESTGLAGISLNSSSTMAYVTDNLSPGYVTRCSVNTDGSFSNCRSQAGDAFNDAYGIAINIKS